MSELIPTQWKYANIGILCTLINGRAFKPAEWSKNGLPIIRIQNLNNSLAEFNYFDGKLDDKHLVKKGDLLFAWSGTPGTSFGAHIWNNSDGALNQHIFKVELNEKYVNKKYLKYAINYKLEELISKAHGGVGLRHVTKGKFEQTEIPLPPLAEQKEIADRLDNLLAQVESIKLRLKKVAEIIKRFKQSVLNVAISGNISADWRASSQYNSENIPVSWKKKYLPEILRFKPQNGYSGKPVKYETKTKVLSLSATTMGVFNPDCFKYLDEFIPEESHVWLKNNDILLQRGNTLEYVGVPAIYKGKDNQYIYPDLMIRLCVQQEIVLSDYLYYYLSSEKIRNYMRKNATGTTGTMPKINQGVLEKLIVNLPPYSEQNVIVERIDKFFKGIQLLEMKIQDAQGYMDNLEKSVLTKAFSGELTAEWREQHPELISGENSAVALLERIKEEKNSVKNSVRPLKSAKNVKIALKRK